MKKILCLFLAAILILSMTACTKEEVVPTETESEIIQEQKPTINETISNKVTEPSESKQEDIWEAEGVRKNGHLPDYWGDLTKEEQLYYNNKIIKALQTFDFDTLETMSMEKDKIVIENLKTIYQNEKYKKMYEQTFGQAQYLPNSGLLIYKSRLYLFNKWLETMENKGEPLPQNTSYISEETVDEWYSKYYDSVPNYCQKFNDWGAMCKLKDGYIYYNLGHTLSIFWTTSLLDSYENNSNKKDLYPLMLFYDKDLSVGYNHLKETVCPQYQDVLNLDLDKIVKYFEEDNRMPKDDYYYEYFAKCYQDKNIRSKIQAWVDENCFTQRGLEDVRIYIPICVKKDSLFKDCTDEELQILKDANLYFGWDVRYSSFDAYHEILETMNDMGALDLESIVPSN